MEGDAGSGQLTPTPALEADERPDSVLSDHVDDAGLSDVGSSDVGSGDAGTIDAGAVGAGAAASASDTRLTGRRLAWVVAGIALAAMLVATAGVLALLGHRRNVTAVSDEALAVSAAKDCITATQAPDVKAMAESQRRIVECSSENFAAQANLYSGLLFDAYQAVNAQVKVADMRAAAEKHNPDGSIDVLVATRVGLTNTQQQGQELSYRLRVRMVPSDGTYKIDNIEPVSK